jgi:hypothetical protein
MHLTRDEFGTWLGRYIEAWRTYDLDAIGDLFSEDVSYSYKGGEAVVTGRAAVVEAWLADPDAPGTWEAHYEPLAIDEEVHVAIGWTRYFDLDREVRDEYSNIFVCRFDEAGRCARFTEWWMRTGPTDEG